MDLILHHIAGDYWIDLVEFLASPKNVPIVRLGPAATALPNGKSLSRSQIESALGYCPLSLPSGSSLAYITPRILAFTPARFLPSIGKGDSELQALEANAKLTVEQFRSARWKRISDTVYSPSTSLKELTEAIVRHTFHDEYSLWLFNDAANEFHLAEASFCSDVNCMSASDPRCTLTEFIKSNSKVISRELKPDSFNKQALAKIKTVTRFKIDSSIPAILSLYSTREQFTPSPYSSRILPEMVRARLQSEIADAYITKSRKLRDITSRYEIGNFDIFLKLLLQRACKELGWEAASVYMQYARDNLKGLMLRATWSSNGASESLPSSIYSSDTPSLTGSVFASAEPICVYDLEKDPRNSHGYDEPTPSPSKNWIGVPIRRDGHPPVGVIRLKNRVVGESVVHFNSLDVKLVETIASTIGYAHHLEELHAKQQLKVQETLKETEEENRNLNEFIKTFRHELKSPLTILTQAANTIQRRLEQEGLISKKKPLPHRISKALSDLDAVGSRLSLVTSYLTFDAHELVRERQKAKVFNEIVAPVTTFSAPYAQKRGRTIEIRHESLTGYSAYCDPGSASMAFHMILDNAIKYSDKETIIIISGRHSNDYFGVRVTSTGTKIAEEERDNIFLKYFRGREARAQKIEGSGIGLYLAGEIVRLNGGSIVLIESSSNVTFELRLPSLRQDR